MTRMTRPDCAVMCNLIHTNTHTHTHTHTAEQKTRHCQSARGIISADRKWRLQVASSFGRKTRRLPDDVVPRGEQGTKDGRDETVTGTETGGRTGRRMCTGMSTRVGMGAGTGAGAGEITGTRIETRMEEGESPLGTYEVVIEVIGLEDARRRATPTSNQQPQSQDPTPQRDRRIISF